jgi:hypothetical protein
LWLSLVQEKSCFQLYYIKGRSLSKEYWWKRVHALSIESFDINLPCVCRMFHASELSEDIETKWFWVDLSRWFIEDKCFHLTILEYRWRRTLIVQTTSGMVINQYGKTSRCCSWLLKWLGYNYKRSIQWWVYTFGMCIIVFKSTYNWNLNDKV